MLAFLVLASTAAHASSVFSTEPGPSGPDVALLEQVGVLLQIIVPLMMFMVVLAAGVYVIGQMLGAETRARATVWAQSMLVAVGISALIIAFLYLILPSFLTGGYVAYGSNIVALVNEIYKATQLALVGLVVLLLVLAAGTYAIGQAFGAETRSRANVWATGMMTGAIVAAVIYVLLFTILPTFGFAFFSLAKLGTYSGVIINITFIVAFIVLITYLLSKVFKVPEWEAYLNIELSNLMASFLIVVFVVGLFSVGNAVAAVYSGGTDITPPTAVISYMRTTVADSVLRGLFDVYQIQACTSILSTFSRRIGEYVLTQTYKVFPGLDTFVSITNVLGIGLVSVYGSISAQITFLYLIDAVIPTFILPAGLILRFFPPTRDAGAFLICLAFGFQIVFPLTYLINKSIYEEIGGTAYQSPRALIASLCGPFKYGVWGVLLNTNANPIFGLVPGGRAVGSILARVFSESLLNFVSMAEFIPIMKHLAELSLLAIFMPALSMTVTLAFINAMTKFIVGKV